MTDQVRDVVLTHLHDARHDGMTWKEMDQATGWHHHGKTTAALSGLHKKREIDKLVERRDKCGIYVMPECVEGREIVVQGGEASPARVSRSPLPIQDGRTESLERALGEVLGNLGKVHKMGRHRPAANCVFCDAFRVLKGSV